MEEISGSSKEKKSGEMTQLNIFSLRDHKYLSSRRGLMAIEVPSMKTVLERNRNVGNKIVGSAIL